MGGMCIGWEDGLGGAGAGIRGELGDLIKRIFETFEEVFYHAREVSIRSRSCGEFSECVPISLAVSEQ